MRWLCLLVLLSATASLAASDWLTASAGVEVLESCYPFQSADACSAVSHCGWCSAANECAFRTTPCGEERPLKPMLPAAIAEQFPGEVGAFQSSSPFTQSVTATAISIDPELSAPSHVFTSFGSPVPQSTVPWSQLSTIGFSGHQQPSEQSYLLNAHVDALAPLPAPALTGQSALQSLSRIASVESQASSFTSALESSA